LNYSFIFASGQPEEPASVRKKQTRMQTLSLFGPYRLAPLTPDDAPEVFESIDTQRRHLGRWLPFVADTRSVEDSRQAVGQMAADGTSNPVFTIRDGKRFAGLIGFKESDPQQGATEIGYWLREEYQGRGIVTAAVERLCRHAFTTMGLRRITIHCAAGNLRSNRIPQRLGFRLDGVERQAERMSDGSLVDLNVYRLDSGAEAEQQYDRSPANTL